MDKKPVTLRLMPENLEKLRELSKAHGLTMGQYVDMLLRKEKNVQKESV